MCTWNREIPYSWALGIKLAEVLQRFLSFMDSGLVLNIRRWQVASQRSLDQSEFELDPISPPAGLIDDFLSDLLNIHF